MQNAILEAAEVYKLIDSKRRRPWVGEEEVRIAWVAALEQGLGIHFDAERARKDSNYNNVIIEFKSPGAFNGTKSSSKFREATEDRLVKYINRTAERQGLKTEDYIGIAIDGEHVCFCQVIDGKLHTEHLLPFSHRTVEMIMDACRNNYRKPITSKNLIEDFGHSSPIAEAFMQSLSDILSDHVKNPKNTKIRMMFEEWRTLYGQVADLSIEQTKSIDKTIRFSWSGSTEDKTSARLFIIHTYNSLLIKLLAAEIVCAHNLCSRQNPAQEMAVLLDDEDLMRRLSDDVENGELFANAGIQGFIEEVIFSWYLDANKESKKREILLNALRDLLAKLSLYLTSHMERTHDVLRDFYQDLVPDTLRKNLGEFYTPDWLVEYLVTHTLTENVLSARVLDPTCGSGSFLREIIQRKIAEAKKEKLSASKTIELLCSTVWGFDLNPLAVQTARVNFLMEMAALLKMAPGTSIEVPILLADAIYSPARNPKATEKVIRYKIGSEVAHLEIALPSSLAIDRIKLDEVFESMGDSVDNDLEYEEAESVLVASKILKSSEINKWRDPLKETYDQVLNLHRMKWNGIWFRIVRNFFWSANAGEFDIIIGNPPWVRWSKLPESYRERVKPTCEMYDIFSKTPYHGGNELDISAMITYTTSDKWLKNGGKLAFVITQSLFQNPSSSGFRNFVIKDNDRICPIVVEDLKQLKPFQDAANKTAIAFFEKCNDAATYPLEYRVWQAKEGETKTINPKLSLENVLAKVDIVEMEANPVDGPGSPWAILKPGRFSQLKKLMGKSSWVEGRKGITADLNGVYFVNILDSNQSKKDSLVQIETRPEAGRKDIGSKKKVWVEPDCLYPLIKGASDFDTCYFKTKKDLYTFVPNVGINKTDYDKSEQLMSTKWKKTSSYFSSFKHLLEKRSTWRTRMPNAPYYAIYNVGDFTFSPWKVIWAEMSTGFKAAVAGGGEVPTLGKRPYVPDHKIYFVPFSEKLPAYYLCGILNSTSVKEFIESHNVSIQTGDIFKHMNLPKYDSKISQHKKLAELTELAHKTAEKNERQQIIEQVIQIADQIISSWIKK